jgi:hypothetical protein
VAGACKSVLFMYRQIQQYLVPITGVSCINSIGQHVSVDSRQSSVPQELECATCNVIFRNTMGSSCKCDNEQLSFVKCGKFPD